MPTDRCVDLLVVRGADEADLADVAEAYLASRGAAQMPPGIHSDDEVRAWVSAWDLSERDVWLAVADQQVVGFANVTPTWLDGLYVVPGCTRSGIGTLLLDLVKSTRPEGFGLWVFEMNAPARAFYARHGLVEVEWTEGAENEEHAPDVRMEWVPSAPRRG